MVNTYKKGSHVILGNNFNSNEFDCPCPQCTTTKIDDELIKNLESMRIVLGPLKINSGFRCAHYQDELRLRGYETAIGLSQHTLGRAADVAGADSQLSGSSLETEARKAGFKAVGVAAHWVHVDLRNDKDRRWTYQKK